MLNARKVHYQVRLGNRSVVRSFYTALITLLAVVFLQPILMTGCAFNANSSAQPPQTQIAPGEWKNVVVGGGGFVTGIYPHPEEPNLIYVRTDMGGFYRWNPDNQSWIPISDEFPLSESNYYGGEALAVDPNNPDVVYIAAGKYLWADPGTILKSTDRGNTWVKSDLRVKMGGNEPLRWAGNRLAVNPFDSNVLLFGSRQEGLWRSRDGGMKWSWVNGLTANTEDKIGILAIAFDPQVRDRVYTSAYGDGVYESTDAGSTWSKMEGSPEKSLKFAIASDSTLYVTHDTGVSKYADGNWQDITPKDRPNTLFNGVSVHPTDPNQVLVSLGDTDSTKIYHSRDGGATWQEKQAAIENQVPWWPEKFFSNHVAAIQFDPNVPERVWLSDWYGVWRTENIEANPVAWTNYVRGHEQVVTFTLVSPPAGPLLISGVADVDGFYHNRLDAFPSQPLGPGRLGLPFQETYSIDYSESQPLNLVRVGGARWNSTYTGATSSDGGLTWKEFSNFPKDILPMRVAVSATDPDRFVVTVSEGQALYTSDRGSSWQPVEGLPNGMGGPWNWSQPLVADSVNGDKFYYYHDNTIYRSEDGGRSFKPVNSSVRKEYWHSLKTLPGVEGDLWLSVDRKGLYRSTDGGNSFSQIPKVDRAHLFSFGKPPEGSDTPALYVYGSIDGSEEGIFWSPDLGETWTKINDPQTAIGNNPNVMEASKQQFGLVFVGTNGRGIFYKSLEG